MEPHRKRHPDRRQRELLLPITSPAEGRVAGARSPESFGAGLPAECPATAGVAEGSQGLRDAASFEQALLAIIAADLQGVAVEYAAEVGNCRERTIENLRQGLNLPRLNTFLRLLGGRANMAVAVFAELRRRGLLDAQTARALMEELAPQWMAADNSDRKRA